MGLIPGSGRSPGEENATHSSILAWEMPWIVAPEVKGFPGGSVVKNQSAKQEIWVQSLGQEDPLEKKMQPTPVFLPGKSHGQRSLTGYSPWGCKELDMT